MMTVVTDVRLREGMERTFDTVMRARMTAAKKRPGQLDPLVDGPEERRWNEVVVDARVGEGERR